MTRLPALANGRLLRAMVLGVLLVLPAAAPATNADADRQLREAADLERRGDWRGAAELYWKLLAADRQSVRLRDKYLFCLRRVRLTDRHLDPLYRKRLQELPLSKALAAYADALGKVQANHVDRPGLTLLFRHGLDELGFALGDPAYRQAHLPDAGDDVIRSFMGQVRDEWDDRDFARPEQVRLAVKQIALDAQKALGVRPAFVVMEFVCGACNALDERTAFLPPGEEYAAHLGQLNALGLAIALTTDNKLVIDKVTPNSWAAGAGLKEGDRVVLPPARADAKGEVGPLTEIHVASPRDPAPRSVKLPDALRSVLDEDVLMGGVGYLRLAAFQANTFTELELALDRLRMRGIRALIIDLRGNPGGLFPVAVQVAERFLPAGVIVTTQGQGPFNRTFESHSGMAAFELPLLVLIDGDTASAAEVLAGALKDNKRATLVGTPTFGKGTIQTVLQLTDAGGVRITLARFFTPRGQPYNGVGVTPDVPDPLRPREAAAEHARALLAMQP